MRIRDRSSNRPIVHVASRCTDAMMKCLCMPSSDAHEIQPWACAGLPGGVRVGGQNAPSARYAANEVRAAQFLCCSPAPQDAAGQGHTGLSGSAGDVSARLRFWGTLQLAQIMSAACKGPRVNPGPIRFRVCVVLAMQTECIALSLLLSFCSR